MRRASAVAAPVDIPVPSAPLTVSLDAILL
jgi:hypothetical protein